MPKAPLIRQRMLQRLALLAALALYLGQSVADAHLHLDEHEEDVCLVCAIADPGHILDVRGASGQPQAWHRIDSVPVFSAILSPRPFEVSHSRAPPVLNS